MLGLADSKRVAFPPLAGEGNEEAVQNQPYDEAVELSEDESVRSSPGASTPHFAPTSTLLAPGLGSWSTQAQALD